jgi:catechol-2,3-dioxygenase
MIPPIDRVLETALYCSDLERVASFYRRVLGFEVLTEIDRLIALDAGGGTVLLLFRRGATVAPIDSPIGRIPAHDGAGPVHLAFAIPTAELGAWERHLAANGIPIESRITWPAGGVSLYFRDPEGHSVELATPGLWRNY